MSQAKDSSVNVVNVPKQHMNRLKIIFKFYLTYRKLRNCFIGIVARDQIYQSEILSRKCFMNMFTKVSTSKYLS